MPGGATDLPPILLSSSGFPRDHTAVPRLCRASEGLDREKRHQLDSELCLRPVRFARCSAHLDTTGAPCAGLSARRLANANEAISPVGSVRPEGPGQIGTGGVSEKR